MTSRTLPTLHLGLQRVRKSTHAFGCQEYLLPLGAPHMYSSISLAPNFSALFKSTSLLRSFWCWRYLDRAIYRNLSDKAYRKKRHFITLSSSSVSSVRASRSNRVLFFFTFGSALAKASIFGFGVTSRNAGVCSWCWDKNWAANVAPGVRSRTIDPWLRADAG